MTPHAKENMKIAEEAALWLHRLEREDTPQVHAEFSAWIKEGAVNLQEFLFAQAVWTELNHIDPVLRAKLDAASTDPDSSVVDLAAVPHSRRGTQSISTERSYERAGRGKPFWWSMAAAAMAVLAVGVLALVNATHGVKLYSTAVGDQRAIKLSDGSVMHLNTDSRVEVRYSKTARALRLLQGEAFFTVEKDASRPFVVTTESARIRALGTQFNVYRSTASETRVTVLDGAVQVSEAAARPQVTRQVRLAAGDEARVDKGSRIIKDVVPNVQQTLAWRSRRLMFPGAPVSEIADEFNRYNRVQIRVEGEALRNRRMSGVFDADDPSPLVRFLSGSPDVEVVRGESEILIRRR